MAEVTWAPEVTWTPACVPADHVSSRRRPRGFQHALEALAAHPGTVIGVLCGHDHKGRYHRDEHGVHHLTFCSPLNKGADGHAYGVLSVAEGALELRGPALADLLPASGSLPPIVPEPGGLQSMSFELPPPAAPRSSL